MDVRQLNLQMPVGYCIFVDSLRDDGQKELAEK